MTPEQYNMKTDAHNGLRALRLQALAEENDPLLKIANALRKYTSALEGANMILQQQVNTATSQANINHTENLRLQKIVEIQEHVSVISEQQIKDKDKALELAQELMKYMRETTLPTTGENLDTKG